MFIRYMLVLVAASATACSTYDERMAKHHKAFYESRLPEAVDGLRLEVADSSSEDVDLVTLELASALQASGHYAEAGQLLDDVASGLEVLDYTTDSVEDVMAFTFSGESETWKATPPERLMVHTQGMINWLAEGDLSGAQVEARSLDVLLQQEDIPDEEKYSNRFATGLAGFCFEQGGNFEEAAEMWSSFGEDANPFARSVEPESPDWGTVLLIGQVGKAPIRMEGIYIIRVDNIVRQLRLPVIVQREVEYSNIATVVDGSPKGDLAPVFDLGAHLVERYSRERGVLMAAAATQLAVRVVAAEVARAVGESLGGDDYGALLGWVMGQGTSAGLAEAMQADTRCWSLLPNWLSVQRLELPPGQHELEINLKYGGSTRKRLTETINLQPRGLVVLNLVTDIHRTGLYTPPPKPLDIDQPEDPDVIAAQSAYEDSYEAEGGEGTADADVEE